MLGQNVALLSHSNCRDFSPVLNVVVKSQFNYLYLGSVLERLVNNDARVILR